MAKWILPVIALCSLGLAGGASAAGAPQILALMQTLAPVPLSCEGDSCRAELSAFCLQQSRDTPQPGTAYVVAGDGRLDLVLRGGDGKRRRLAAEGEVTLASARGHAAVSVTLSRARLTALGADGAAIEVGAGVSLLPAALAAASAHEDDPAVLLATGAWREIGAGIVEAGGGSAISQVRAVNALINALPARPAPTLATDEVWHAAVAGPLAAAHPQGLAAARERLENCGQRWRFYSFSPVRHCLQLRHDAVVEQLTLDYWKAVGAGS